MRDLEIDEIVYIIDEHKDIIDYAVKGRVIDILFETYNKQNTFYRIDTDEGEYYLSYPDSIEPKHIVTKEEYLEILKDIMMANSKDLARLVEYGNRIEDKIIELEDDNEKRR